MPRKNARPAARKKRAMLHSEMAKHAEFARLTKSFGGPLRHGDHRKIAAIHASIFSKAGTSKS